jgi:hypothetical protein
MTVRWALTYKVDDVDVFLPANMNSPSTKIIDPSDVANFPLSFFHGMRYSFKAPTRAFKTLVEFSHSPTRIEAALLIASGTPNPAKHNYTPNTNLLLKHGAFAIVGKTDELAAFLRRFPNAVTKISVAPGERFGAGYARVGEKNRLGVVKNKETLIIIAPEGSWWSKRRPQEAPAPIHTPTSWRPFVEPVMGNEANLAPVALGESIQMTTIASWLSRCDRDDPWVFPAQGLHEDNDPPR